VASVINTNIASLNTQRSLSMSQSSLATSLQRLSSGLRINSAKDDAAGLAISDRMTSQIRGMTQAARNANDGVSMAQTAEGAMASSGDILQRIRELAVQSSNASNSASDRKALQTEVSQLGSELNRIAQTTAFNGQTLLDGTMGTTNFQVGANANELISTSGSNFLTNTYGDNRIDADAVQAKATTNVVAAQAIDVSGYLGKKTYTTQAGDTAKSIAAGINGLTTDTGVAAAARTDVLLDLEASKSFSIDLTSDNGSAVTISFSTGAGGNADDFAAGIAAFNAQSAKTGVTAEYDVSNKGIKLVHASGNNIQLANNATTTGTLALNTYNADKTLVATPLTVAAGSSSIVNGRVTLDSEKSFSVVDAGSGLALTGSSALKPVSSLDVTSFDNAQLAIRIADAALASVNGKRAEFGAMQSRFMSAIANLQSTTENLSASRSRIVDTDFAAETSTLTRGQILQQAGTAMLAQANSLPSSVLSLLGQGG
jgi:flagellin